jgi:hypothetical protein
MSILALTSNTLVTAASGQIEYDGQFFGTDSNASRAQLQRIVRATAVASTSGTAIDFTGIPAWVEKITVMFSGVSTNGTSPVILQLGSTTIQTTGYLSFAMNGITSGVTTVAGMLLTANQSAAGTHTGNFMVTNITSNSWVASGVMQDTVNANGSIFSSSVSLAGVLDRVRITTVNGTDAFDAGSINIMYEG